MNAVKQPPRQRRTVSNEEFRLAYKGISGDAESERKAADNRNVIRSVMKLYQDKIPDDSLEDCGLTALWRTLQYHQSDFNQKFTTSLYRFCHWECRRELRKLYGRRKQRTPLFLPLLGEALEKPARAEESERDELLGHIRECMEMLPYSWQKKLVEQHFISGLTMKEIGAANGFSKETARKRVSKAVQALREICHAALA